MEHIGKITVNQQLNMHRAARRQDEVFDNGNGWKAKNKVHKSDKSYSRNPKHKNRFDN
tara:strand:- start:465 stop:638 length:174 start_codon:yes stop_codon:yes gene_type:complete